MTVTQETDCSDIQFSIPVWNIFLFHQNICHQVMIQREKCSFKKCYLRVFAVRIHKEQFSHSSLVRKMRIWWFDRLKVTSQLHLSWTSRITLIVASAMIVQFQNLWQWTHFRRSLPVYYYSIIIGQFPHSSENTRKVKSQNIVHSLDFWRMFVNSVSFPRHFCIVSRVQPLSPVCWSSTRRHHLNGPSRC